MTTLPSINQNRINTNQCRILGPLQSHSLSLPRSQLLSYQEQVDICWEQESVNLLLQCSQRDQFRSRLLASRLLLPPLQLSTHRLTGKHTKIRNMDTQ